MEVGGAFAADANTGCREKSAGEGTEVGKKMPTLAFVGERNSGEGAVVQNEVGGELNARGEIEQ